MSWWVLSSSCYARRLAIKAKQPATSAPTRLHGSKQCRAHLGDHLGGGGVDRIFFGDHLEDCRLAIPRGGHGALNGSLHLVWPLDTFGMGTQRLRNAGVAT